MVAKEESVELRKHLDSRVIFVGLYAVAFLAYIIFGLQPAGAAKYVAQASLSIPSAELYSDVAETSLTESGFGVPDEIVGSYSEVENKILLIGHSTTAFKNLHQVKLDAEIDYNGKSYRVVAIDMVPKEEIDMLKVLGWADRETLVLMTCAGKLLDGGDATHRLIVTAVES